MNKFLEKNKKIGTTLYERISRKKQEARDNPVQYVEKVQETYDNPV